MNRPQSKAFGAGAAMIVLSAFVPNLNLTDKFSDFNLNLAPVGEAYAQAKTTGVLKFNAFVSNPLKISLIAKANFGQFAVAGTGSIVVQTTGATTANNQIINTAGANGVITVQAPNGIGFSLSLTKYDGGNIYMATPGGGGAGASPSKTMTITEVRIKATNNMNGKLGVYKSGNPKVTGYSVTVGSTGRMVVGTTIQIDGSEVIGTYSGSTMLVMSL